jgi:hypothetical protein
MSGKAVRETLGFLAVVAGLVFVGLEIRQNTQVARGQTRIELTALNNEFLRTVGDPEFAETWRRAWIPGEELGEPEEFRVELVTLQYLRLLENVHLQHQEGLIDREALDSYGFWGFREQFMAHPRFPLIWEPRRVSFDPEFVAFLEGTN